ncbi:hypothetical protein TKK_0000831 [Trichogramma kaykai]|uniref:PRANC domain-containing protein n=1 Tax=Trichogramma kaykai TaxID=54128 RepID=A0ABD2VVV6_9HYME
MSIDFDDHRSYEYDNFGKVKFIPVYNPRYELIRTPSEEDLHSMIKCKIESGLVDPNSINGDGELLWHYICQSLGDDNVDLATSLFSLRFEQYQPVQIDARDNFGRTALHLAVYNNLERITGFLLDHNANPNLANDKGETPLHVICRIDKYDSDHMQFDHPYDEYHTPHERQRHCVERQKRMIELLLSRGANPNAPDANGFTPLHIVCQKKCDDDYVRMCNRDELPNVALYRNHHNVIKSMLRRGADPTVANAEGLTPLHFICKGYGDNLKLAKTLFKLADERYGPILVDARDDKGETPLHLALREDNRRLVQWLLRRGANRTLANSKGETPLHIICQGNQEVACLGYWIFKWSDVDDRHPREQIDARDNSNNTPLHFAASQGHVYLVDFLLEEGGADPNLANDKGETPLHVLCQKKCDYDDESEITIEYRHYQGVAESMLRRGADPTVANAEGSTPLHVLCKGYGDNLQLAETLFKLADERYRPILRVDARDGNGETPLHLATNQSGNNKLVDFLLRRGADKNAANDKRETPLHNICRRGDIQMLQIFFDVNQEVNEEVAVDAVDSMGRTPLQWAVANFRIDLIDALLDRGADLSSFVFPDQPHFYERFTANVEGQFLSKVELASGIMMVVEHLEDKGFDLERSDALMIMKLFAEYGLFEKSTTIEICLKFERFANLVKRVIIKPNLSLHDLIQLRPKEAAKQLTYKDYFELVGSKIFGRTFGAFRWPCFAHLCEKLSKKFFRMWALYPFQELIHYRLPEEICEIIIEKLSNEDLYHICLAVEGLN